jgi:hypothetical protein
MDLVVSFIINTFVATLKIKYVFNDSYNEHKDSRY